MKNSNLQSAVKNATHKLAKALEDASELRVETRYILTDAAGAEAPADDKGRLLARTVMKLDGDTELVIPMNRDDAGQLQTNQEIFDLHLRNVKVALEYRSGLLNSLLSSVSALG